MPDAVEPVSVVMPVCNAMPFLDAAIESILAAARAARFRETVAPAPPDAA